MGKKLSSMDSQAAFLDDLSQVATRWDVLYIAEVDGHLNNDGVASLFGGAYTWKRHWPGVGSYACAIVFKNTFTGLVKKLKFCGRAALCVASVSSSSLSSNGSKLCGLGGFNGMADDGSKWWGMGCFSGQRSAACGVNLCFLHGSHDDLNGTLSSVASLLKKGRDGFQNFLVGDFNVDLLPAASPDPFCTNINRYMHHKDRRLQLSNLCKIFKLSLVPVKQIVGGLGGAYDELCQRFPITRLPFGDQGGLPSRLDYVFASQGPESSLRHLWHDVWADHCLLELHVKACTVSRPHRIKSTWHCKDERGLTLALQSSLPLSFRDITTLHDVCVGYQEGWKSTLSCKDRRMHRESPQIKELRRLLRGARTEAQRSELQHAIISAKRHIAATT